VPEVSVVVELRVMVDDDDDQWQWSGPSLRRDVGPPGKCSRGLKGPDERATAPKRRGQTTPRLPSELQERGPIQTHRGIPGYPNTEEHVQLGSKSL